MSDTRCFGFASLRSLIGSKNSRHFLNQSDAKLKPIVTWSHAFSRAWSRLRVFASSSDWFLVLFSCVLIGQSDHFSFGFTTIIENRSMLVCFTSLCDWFKRNSSHLLDQSDVKPIVTWSHACFPALIAGYVHLSRTLIGSLRYLRLL